MELPRLSCFSDEPLREAVQYGAMPRTLLLAVTASIAFEMELLGKRCCAVQRLEQCSWQALTLRIA